MTQGEKLMGVSFNPSKDPRVDAVKASFAALADKVYEATETSYVEGTLTAQRELLSNNALTNLVNAQMSVVKLLTFQTD